MFATVAELWRYPVKSLLGEQLQEVQVEERGVVGDRLYAVTDRRGKLGSGKTSRRFRRLEGLFDEYDVRLGKALDPPQTDAWSNGVYRRRYERAMVLVNPDVTPRTVAPGPGWRRFKGQQAPTVNSGQAAEEVTLAPRDAIVLVKD